MLLGPKTGALTHVYHNSRAFGLTALFSLLKVSRGKAVMGVVVGDPSASKGKGLLYTHNVVCLFPGKLESGRVAGRGPANVYLG